MPKLTKRKAQIQEMRKLGQAVLADKRARTTAPEFSLKSTELDFQVPGWLAARLNQETEEGLWNPEEPVGLFEDSDLEDENDEVEVSDDEDEVRQGDQAVFRQYQTAFEELMDTSAEDWVWAEEKLRYTRGPNPSQRSIERKIRNEKEMRRAASGCRPITDFLQPEVARHNNMSGVSTVPPPALVNVPDTVEPLPRTRRPQSKEERIRHDAITDLERKLKSKNSKSRLEGQNLMRHWAVLSFMWSWRARKMGETRIFVAGHVARNYNRGVFFARKIVQWERTWISDRQIEEGRQGCFQKIGSWFEDEGVQLEIRAWLAEVKDKVTAHGLAKRIGDYLESTRAQDTVRSILLSAEDDLEDPIDGPCQNLDESTTPKAPGRRFAAPGRIRARTARRWLHKMGLEYNSIAKGVYFDGHERPDVVDYRQNIFIPQFEAHRKRMVVFKEDGTWELPLNMPAGEKPLVLVTHDESTFNANDGKRRMWMKKGQQPIRPKSRGKGIMVSGFLTPGGRLRVPTNIPDSELLKDPTWPLEDGKPIRDAMHFLEYGKDNYWTGDKMVDHTIQVVVKIFAYAFPRCQALFVFDNASNHCCYAKDALVASKINLNPGGKQPLMRETWMHNKQRPQTMFFSENHPQKELRGKAKGAEVILRERGLWPEDGRNPWGEKFLLECPTTQNRTGCKATGPDAGRCCARAVLAHQRDFLDQKGRLEEEIRRENHEVIFYPKFHCELNFIERYWCGAKYYARENCEYSLDGLRQVLPAALDSVSTASINRYFNHCLRILEAYRDGIQYGTTEFTAAVHKTHRKIQDKSKY